MKNTLFFLAVCTLFYSSPLKSAIHSKVLDIQDLDREIQDSLAEHGAVSILREDGKLNEFYNHWICLDRRNIGLHRVAGVEEGQKIRPLLNAELDGKVLQISLPAEYGNDESEAYYDWKFLTDDVAEVCVYATKPGKYWESSILKTSKGTWEDGVFTDSNVVVNAEMRLSLHRIHDYEVAVAKNVDTGEAKVVITQKGRIVFEESGLGEFYYLGNEFDELERKRGIRPGQNITGNFIPNLVISKWTGGMHCCHVLSVFELGQEFRVLVNLEAQSSSIHLVDLDHDGIREIEFWDGAIDYLFSSFAESPGGRVILKFTGDKYEVAYDLMKSSVPNQPWNTEMGSKLNRAFVSGEASIPYQLLELMMDLSYSGQFNRAMEVANHSWPKTKPGLFEFKRAFKEALLESPYWRDFNSK